MSIFKGKSTVEGRLAAFNLAGKSNALTLGSPVAATEKCIGLADWIGKDDEKLECVQLISMLPMDSTSFIYLVNHAKSLYGELTGATKPKAAEPPSKEKAAPAKADNAAPSAGTARRPVKRPRVKKAS